jgi:hypothetical protein
VAGCMVTPSSSLHDGRATSGGFWDGLNGSNLSAGSARVDGGACGLADGSGVGGGRISIHIVTGSEAAGSGCRALHVAAEAGVVELGAVPMPRYAAAAAATSLAAAAGSAVAPVTLPPPAAGSAGGCLLSPSPPFFTGQPSYSPSSFGLDASGLGGGGSSAPLRYLTVATGDTLDDAPTAGAASGSGDQGAMVGELPAMARRSGRPLRGSSHHHHAVLHRQQSSASEGLATSHSAGSSLVNPGGAPTAAGAGPTEGGERAAAALLQPLPAATSQSSSHSLASQASAPRRPRHAATMPADGLMLVQAMDAAREAPTWCIVRRQYTPLTHQQRTLSGGRAALLLQQRRRQRVGRWAGRAGFGDGEPQVVSADGHGLCHDQPVSRMTQPRPPTHLPDSDSGCWGSAGAGAGHHGESSSSRSCSKEIRGMSQLGQSRRIIGSGSCKSHGSGSGRGSRSRGGGRHHHASPPPAVAGGIRCNVQALVPGGVEALGHLTPTPSRAAAAAALVFEGDQERGRGTGLGGAGNGHKDAETVSPSLPAHSSSGDSFDMVPEHAEQLLINRMEMSRELQVGGWAMCTAGQSLNAFICPHVSCCSRGRGLPGV